MLGLNKKKAILYIIIGILLLPILILLSPVLLILHFKNKRAEQKKRQQSWEKWVATHQPTQFQTRCTESFRQPDEEFIRRVGEFTVLQFISRNDYTGRERKRELIAAEHPEKKAQILEFLKEHPIEELLRAERYENAHDANRWELRFIFEDAHLNCAISGYGHTEAAAPYLSGICRQIPPILTDEEKFRMKAQKARLEWEMQKFTSTPEN